MKLRWHVAQAMEIRWWQRYLKSKTVADYHVWKRAYWQEFLEKIGLKKSTIIEKIKLQNLENQRATEGGQRAMLLDAGCGPAGIFMIFEGADPTIGVDALDPLLNEYEAKLPHFKKSDYPHTRFLAKPLEDLEAREKYDFIFCINAINHVADLQKSFQQLVNAAKRGATLVVSIDAHNFQPLKHLFRLIPGDILHPHQYDLQEYENMLVNCGCRVEKSVLSQKEFIFNYYILIATKQ